MIPAALSQAKSDPRIPAVARVLLWCMELQTSVAPKIDAVAHECRLPRTTAARSVRMLVACGYLTRDSVHIPTPKRLDLHRSRCEEYCYIIRAGDSGPFKIGMSIDVVARMVELQTNCPEPLHVLAILPGGRLVEQALHEMLARHRMHGEWFSPQSETEVRDYISRSENRTEGPRATRPALRRAA